MTDGGTSEPGRSAAMALGMIDGVLADDRPCLACGYSLRGLAPDGACPECAKPIRESLRGDLFMYSHPAHVRRLQRGAGFAFLGVLALALAGVGGMALGIAASLAGWMPGAVATVVGWVVGLVAPLAYLTGWWMLTTPSPRRSSIRGVERARLVCRYAVVVTAAFTATGWLGSALSTAAGTTAPMGGGPPGLSPLGAASWAASLGAIPAHMVVFFAGVLMVGRMAPRFGRLRDIRSLRRQSKTLLILGVVLASLTALWLLAIVIVLAAPASGVAGGAASTLGGLGATGAMCAGSILGVVTYVMYLTFLDRVRSALGRVARAQRQARRRSQEATSAGLPELAREGA